MVLLQRIEIVDGKTLTQASDTTELLDVLADVEIKVRELNPIEEETLRGWLLVRAEAMTPGQIIANHRGTHVSLGKTADGRAFIKDVHGEWPPARLKEKGDLF